MIIPFRFNTAIVHRKSECGLRFHRIHHTETISSGKLRVGQYYILLSCARSVTRQEGHIFVVDEDRCFGCAACVALCPVDALCLDGLLVYVEESACTHCELCIPSCPVFALDIVQESVVEVIM